MQHARMAWVPVNRAGEPRRYELNLGERLGIYDRLVLLETSIGRWRAGWQHGTTKTVLADNTTFDLAERAAVDHAVKMGATKLAALDAPWRRARPKLAQRELAAKLHLDVPVGATRGEVSEMIDAALARKRHRRTA